MDEQVEMISKEMEKLGVTGAKKAYDLLRPYAFKKDLFEWMALWHYGGIWLDAKIGLQRNMSDWVDFKNDEFVMCGTPQMVADNSMLMMTQYHPFGLQMVQEIVFKVNERLYDDPNEKNFMDWPWLSNLNITGPDALKSFLRSDN